MDQGSKKREFGTLDFPSCLLSLSLGQTGYRSPKPPSWLSVYRRFAADSFPYACKAFSRITIRYLTHRLGK